MTLSLQLPYKSAKIDNKPGICFRIFITHFDMLTINPSSSLDRMNQTVHVKPNLFCRCTCEDLVTGRLSLTGKNNDG